MVDFVWYGEMVDFVLNFRNVFMLGGLHWTYEKKCWEFLRQFFLSKQINFYQFFSFLLFCRKKKTFYKVAFNKMMCWKSKVIFLHLFQTILNINFENI